MSETPESKVQLIPLDANSAAFAVLLYREMMENYAISSHLTFPDATSEVALADPNSLWRIAVMDGKFVGLCGLNHINYVDRTAEPHGAVVEGHRHSHVVHSMMVQVIDIAFTQLNLNHIQCLVPEGSPAQKLVEQIPATEHEGVLRKARFQNGKLVDVFIYGLLRKDLREWKRAQAEK